MYRVYEVNAIIDYVIDGHANLDLDYDICDRIRDRIMDVVSDRKHRVASIYFYVVDDGDYLRNLYPTNGLLLCGLRRFV